MWPPASRKVSADRDWPVTDPARGCDLAVVFQQLLQLAQVYRFGQVAVETRIEEAFAVSLDPWPI